MTPEPFTVLLPTSIRLNPLPVPGVRYAPYDPLAPLPAELEGAQGLVVWGNARRQLADCARRMTRLRWVQTLAAGPDEVLAAGFAPGVIVTCGRGLHDAPVAEHTLALLLAAVRDVPAALRAQAEHRWARELGWQEASAPATVTPAATADDGPAPTADGTPAPTADNAPAPTADDAPAATADGARRPRLRSLLGANVLIWGFGSIAQHLAPMLTQLGADVTGVAQRAGERAGYEVVTAPQARELLGSTDVLIGLLPATPETHHVLGASVFEALPDHAIVVNVGRGATLDEAALVAALRAGRLGGAALDVFETEPLPADSPLWDLPGVIVTPHGAGGRPLGADGRIAANAAALLAGEPMTALVSR